jgi:CrcB protein
MAWIPIAISVGAVLGALGRYYATVFWLEKKGSGFPYGTLFVNVTGSFLLGVISTVVMTDAVPVVTQQLVITGFLGAFTTFSSYILETFNLLSRGNLRVGVLYGIGSSLGGFLSIGVGIWLGK